MVTLASQLRLCLLQPVRHPHLAIHRRRRGEMLLRPLALADAPGELAKAEVAVGDEGAYASLWPSALIQVADRGRVRQGLCERPVVNAGLDSIDDVRRRPVCLRRRLGAPECGIESPEGRVGLLELGRVANQFCDCQSLA